MRKEAAEVSASRVVSLPPHLKRRFQADPVVDAPSPGNLSEVGGAGSRIVLRLFQKGGEGKNFPENQWRMEVLRRVSHR